jgi:hypothetical protein
VAIYQKLFGHHFIEVIDAGCAARPNGGRSGIILLKKLRGYIKVSDAIY